MSKRNRHRHRAKEGAGLPPHVRIKFSHGPFSGQWIPAVESELSGDFKFDYTLMPPHMPRHLQTEILMAQRIHQILAHPEHQEWTCAVDFSNAAEWQVLVWGLVEGFAGLSEDQIKFVLEMTVDILPST